VFDQAFFLGEFAEKTREFLQAHGEENSSVEFATLGGERLDVVELRDIGANGMALVTRSERLVFLPYAQLAYVEITVQRDHRIASFQLPPTARER
jgi:hypothetical protein